MLVRRLLLVTLLTSLRDEWLWTWLTLANYLLLSIHHVVQQGEEDELWLFV